MTALTLVGSCSSGCAKRELSCWGPGRRIGWFMEQRLEEPYFLHHILHFIEQELSEHPTLNSAHFARWIRNRRQQIVRGELIYIAHQLDVLARQEEGGREV